MSKFLKRSNGLTAEPSLRAYTTYIKLIEDEIGDLPLAALEDRRIRFMTFVGQQLFDSHFCTADRVLENLLAGRHARITTHPLAEMLFLPSGAAPRLRTAKRSKGSSIAKGSDSFGSLGLAFEL
jgi:hypothetical protein